MQLERNYVPMVINYLTIHVEIAVEEEQRYYIRYFFVKRKWTLALKALINCQSLLSAPHQHTTSG